MGHLFPLRFAFLSSTGLLLALSLLLAGCGFDGVGSPSDVELPADSPADQAPADDLDPADEQDAAGLVPVGQLACGDRFNGDTGAAQATNRVATYSCSGWDATGPEMTFAYVAEVAGQVTASIAELATEQDLEV